jgi:hypothetical protein
MAKLLPNADCRSGAGLGGTGKGRRGDEGEEGDGREMRAARCPGHRRGRRYTNGPVLAVNRSTDAAIFATYVVVSCRPEILARPRRIRLGEYRNPAGSSRSRAWDLLRCFMHCELCADLVRRLSEGEGTSSRKGSRPRQEVRSGILAVQRTKILRQPQTIGGAIQETFDAQMSAVRDKCKA